MEADYHQGHGYVRQSQCHFNLSKPCCQRSQVITGKVFVLNQFVFTQLGGERYLNCRAITVVHDGKCHHVMSWSRMQSFSLLCQFLSNYLSTYKEMKTNGSGPTSPPWLDKKKTLVKWSKSLYCKAELLTSPSFSYRVRSAAPGCESGTIGEASSDDRHLISGGGKNISVILCVKVVTMKASNSGPTGVWDKILNLQLNAQLLKK